MEAEAVISDRSCWVISSNLHLWMHAAVHYGPKSTGRAGCDQTVPSRRQHCLFILVESFQWRVLTWTLQLVPSRKHVQTVGVVIKYIALNRKLLYLDADTEEQIFSKQLINFIWQFYMLHITTLNDWRRNVVKWVQFKQIPCHRMQLRAYV